MAIPIGEDPYSSKNRYFKKTSEKFNEDVIVPRPSSLDRLCHRTKFSRDELRRLYRFFKQLCPYGVLDEKGFKKMYAVLFPKGDSDEYAHFVFKAMDMNQDELVCFEDIADAYSTLTRGSLSDKLDWIFKFYDINRTKKIGRLDMLKVVTSFYALFDPDSNNDLIFERVNTVFQGMVRPGEHYLTKTGFMEYCLRNPHILEAFNFFSPSTMTAKLSFISNFS